MLISVQFDRAVQSLRLSTQQAVLLACDSCLLRVGQSFVVCMVVDVGCGPQQSIIGKAPT
jgi:hypothetical protein